jgi:nicotinamide-nucleotide amidase
VSAQKSVVVCVGDELLTGLVVNTNVAMIGELMLEAGLPVTWSTTIGDEIDAIVRVLEQASVDADIVIVTGGLGPTQDDLTSTALAKLVGTELVRDEEVVEGLRRRFEAFGREMPPSNAKQADLPRGATWIANPYGTAPGIRIEHNGAVLYAMPGVPGEARHMLIEQILPELTAAGIAHLIKTRVFHCVGLPESELADRFPDLATAPNPKMAFLPGGGEIRLRFVATGETIEACEAALEQAGRVVMQRIGDFVFGVDEVTLEGVVGAMLTERGLTVSTAESCTAGLLSSRIASVPGASKYLRGAVVAYASEVKSTELGVPAELIDKAGAVSEEVAAEMALGAKRKFSTDIALAVTCVAGPGESDGVPAGTAVLALAGVGGDLVVRTLRLPGDRPQVRQFATTFALSLLRLHLISTADSVSDGGGAPARRA